MCPKTSPAPGRRHAPASHAPHVTMVSGGGRDTRAIHRHAVSGTGDAPRTMVEKIIERQITARLIPPEAIFYRHVRPRWPFIRAHSPALIASKARWRTVHLFLEDVQPATEIKHLTFPQRMDMIRAMQESAPQSFFLRLLVPSYFLLPRRARFRGNYAAYLTTLAAHIPAMAAHTQTMQRNLRRLERLCRAAPHVLSHLDITKKNILMRDEGYSIIDWGEFCRAPAGFDYGSALFTALKSNPRRLPEAIEYFHAMALPGETCIGAYYFFALSILYRIHVMAARGELKESLPVSLSWWLMPLTKEAMDISPALLGTPDQAAWLAAYA